MSPAPIKIAVMVSGQGRGSNMQAIIDACVCGKINGSVDLVIGVNEDAPAMQRAKSAGVKTIALSPKSYEIPQGYDDAIYKVLIDNNIDLICLAGYMRLLGETTVKHFENKIMNVHPALIPMFFGKGMYGHHVHEAAIKRGVKVSGATVHFVDAEYDTGPIILQSVVEVDFNDTPETLAAKILPIEHKTYTDAISLFSQSRLLVDQKKVKII